MFSRLGVDMMKNTKITWEDIKRKLTSRKLWVSVGAFVSLVIIAKGGTESEAAQAVELITAGAVVIAYIIGEGLVDAENKKDPEELQ